MFTLIDKTTPYCCKIGCPKAPEWEIWSNNGDPYSYTHACTEHVGELLTDAPVHHVYPLPATEVEHATQSV